MSARLEARTTPHWLRVEVYGREREMWCVARRRRRVSEEPEIRALG